MKKDVQFYGAGGVEIGLPYGRTVDIVLDNNGKEVWVELKSIKGTATGLLGAKWVKQWKGGKKGAQLHKELTADMVGWINTDAGLNPIADNIRWLFHKFKSNDRTEKNPLETNIKNRFNTKLCTTLNKTPDATQAKNTFNMPSNNPVTKCKSGVTLGNLGQLADLQQIINMYIRNALYDGITSITELD